MKYLVFSLLILISSTASSEDPREKWDCQDSIGVGPILITVIADQETDLFYNGSVSTVGIKHEAAFQISGLERQWWFGEGTGKSEGYWNYAFIIELDGTGKYYDFSGSEPGGRAKPKEIYKCKRTAIQQ